MASKPQVLFENHLDTADSLSATSSASGFPLTNVLDWRPYTRWKAANTTAPCDIEWDMGSGNTALPTAVAIAGHNLADAAATIQLYYSSDGISYTAAQTPTGSAPSTNGVYWRAKDSALVTEYRYWRLRLDKAGGTFSAVPQIGALVVGRALTFESGPQESLDPYGREVVVDESRNEYGAPVGANVRYVRKVFDVSYGAPGMTRDGFYRPSSGLTFDGDFVGHAINSALPFFFAWNYDEDVTELGFDGHAWVCRCRSVSMPHVGSLLRRSLSAQFEGWREVG